MRLLFLDFDGVISTYEKKWMLDESKIEILRRIVDETGARIVVTSSWKVGCKNVGRFRELLGKRGAGKAEWSDGALSWLAGSIYDITDNRGGHRGGQVQRWLDAHNDDVESYVILDDDDDFSESQLFNFVQTDIYEGLTEREAKLCIRILKGERVVNPIRLNLVLTTMWRNNCSGVESSNIRDMLKEYYGKFTQ